MEFFALSTNFAVLNKRITMEALSEYSCCYKNQFHFNIGASFRYIKARCRRVDGNAGRDQRRPRGGLRQAAAGAGFKKGQPGNPRGRSPNSKNLTRVAISVRKRGRSVETMPMPMNSIETTITAITNAVLAAARLKRSPASVNACLSAAAAFADNQPPPPCAGRAIPRKPKNALPAAGRPRAKCRPVR
jgi:hypothetical protein